MGRFAVVQGRDQRLEDRRGAVIGAQIAPLLQRVRLGDVPGATRRRLVLVLPEPDSQPHLVERRGETEIDGGGEDRVAPEDHQRIDPPRRHVGGQGAQRVELPGRAGWCHRHVVQITDRLPEVAERRVNRRRQGVDRRRLLIARDDEARAPVCVQVAHERRNPAGLCGGESRIGISAEIDADATGDRAGQRRHLARA